MKTIDQLKALDEAGEPIKIVCGFDQAQEPGNSCCTFGYIENGVINILAVYHGKKAEEFYRAYKISAYQCKDAELEAKDAEIERLREALKRIINAGLNYDRIEIAEQALGEQNDK